MTTNSQKKPETLFLLLILIAAGVLRFYNYGGFSYSNDELSALNRLHYNTFAELVQKGFYVDGHPGGIQIFLWQWLKLFGDNEWAVRFPFVVFGILAVWFSFKVAKFMFGTAAGLFTAAALSFLQFPLLYSQIARPYGSGMLFCLMLVYFWLQLFFDKNGKLNNEKPRIRILAGFALSASLCMYNHYFSFLFALIVGFSGFVFARKNNVFHYISAALVAALLFVPHIPITLNHLTYKGVGLWLGVPDKMWIFGHIFYIFDQSVFILSLFLTTLLALLFVEKQGKSMARFRILLATWFLLPILIGYIYSVKVNPVLQHPVLIFSFPCFILLIFSYAGNAFNKLKPWILAVFLISGITGTTLINKYYQAQHFGEFKDIARLTAEWEQKYGDSNITKAISINSPYYINYYLKRYNCGAKFAVYDINGIEGLEALSTVAKNSKTPYFLYALTKPAPAEGEDIIRSFYPFVVDMKNYGALSSIVLFGKAAGSTYEQANGLTEIKSLNANLTRDTAVQGKTAGAYKMDSVTEYSPAMELNLDEFINNGNLVFAAETDLFSGGSTAGSALVISIETADGKSLYWKGAESRYIETPNTWQHSISTLKMETPLPIGAKLKVYFWNKDKKVLYLKNLGCRVFE